MKIVADTNIFLAVALEEPEKQEIIRLTSNAEIIAPEILPYEIGNALTAMFKRRRLAFEEVLTAFMIVNQIPVKLIPVDITQALEIALKFNLYAYDAYFLQSAISLSCPLLTLDKQMKQIAVELNIQMLEVL